MLVWINQVWRNRPNRFGKKSLLFLDSFKSHKLDSVKAKLLAENTDRAIIPGGLTSLVQPLDVSINKPFKDRLKNLWNAWMIKRVEKKAPTRILLAKWVKEAWDDIPEEIVRKAFKKCGISNALDGSEDHLLEEEEIMGTEELEEAMQSLRLAETEEDEEEPTVDAEGEADEEEEEEEEEELEVLEEGEI